MRRWLDLAARLLDVRGCEEIGFPGQDVVLNQRCDANWRPSAVVAAGLTGIVNDGCYCLAGMNNSSLRAREELSSNAKSRFISPENTELFRANAPVAF